MPLKANQPPPTDFSGAVAEIDLNDASNVAYLRSSVAIGQGSGREAWNWYDKIGEVHHAISRSSRIAGFADLKAVRFRPNSTTIESEVETGPAAEAVAQIYSIYGGTRGLIERFYTHMKVPGDTYLIRMRDKQGHPDGYHLASPNELDTSSFSRWRPGKSVLKLTTVPAAYGDGDSKTGSPYRVEIRPEDMLGRIWSPSKQWADIPESALHALSIECDVLDKLTQSMRAQLLSRFALAGILFLPPGVTMARRRRGGKMVAGQQIDDVTDLLIAAMTRNVRNHDDATAMLPIILKGANAEDGEKIKHIILDRSIAETDLKLRAELIDRILMGLDSNQDQTKGTSDQSHWSAWQSSDDERRVAIAPDLEGFCWALSRLVLRPLKGVDPNIGVWYDLTRAATKSNQQEDARQAWDRVLIGDEPARRMSGIPETDRPNEVEVVQGVGRQVKNPYLMLYGSPEFDNIDWEMVKATGIKRGPAPDSPADESEVGPGVGEPGSPDDQDTDTPRTQRPA